MPLYTYIDSRGVQIERLFSLSERPDSVTEDGVEYQRVPSVPAPVHSSFGTWNGSKPDYCAINRNGQTIREPGMREDAKRYAKEREAKKEKHFEKAAADAVRDVLI